LDLLLVEAKRLMVVTGAWGDAWLDDVAGEYSQFRLQGWRVVRVFGADLGREFRVGAVSNLA